MFYFEKQMKLLRVTVISISFWKEIMKGKEYFEYSVSTIVLKYALSISKRPNLYKMSENIRKNVPA